MDDLSLDEKEIYDRQIRVWGLNSQLRYNILRLRSSTIFIYNFSVINSEIAKDAVLGGVNLLIYDNSIVTLEDLNTLFFFTQQDIGKKVAYIQKSTVAAEKISQLNGFAKVSSVEELNESVWQDVKCVCADKWSVEEALELDRITAARGISVYYVVSSYMRAYCISIKRANTHDTLLQLLHHIPHALKAPRKRQNLPFKCFLRNVYLGFIHSEFFDSEYQAISAEEVSLYSELKSTIHTYFNPTSSILGGLICNDMIQFLTSSLSNFQSYLLFDAYSSESYVDYI